MRINHRSLLIASTIFLGQALCLPSAWCQSAGFADAMAKGRDAYAKLDFAAAATCFQEALDKAASDDAHAAEALNNLGLIYDLQNKDNEAVNYYQRALQLREKNAADEIAKVPLLNNLGGLELKHKRFDNAIGFYQRALKILDVATTPPARVASELNNLALAYQAKGDYANAEAQLRRAIEIVEKLASEQREEAVTLISNLGEILGIQEKYSAAETAYKHALDLEQQNQPPNLQRLAAVQNRLAALYRDQGRYEEAQPYIQKSLEYAEKSGDTRTLTIALNNMALLDREQGKQAEAVAIYQKVLAALATAGGAGTQDTVNAYRNMGTALLEQGNYQGALDNYNAAVRTLDSIPSASFDAKAEIQADILELRRQQGDLGTAEKGLSQMVADYSKANGQCSPQVQKTLNDLGIVLEQQALYPRAEIAFQQSLDVARTVYGAASMQAALALENLAHVFIEENKLDAAASSYKESLSIKEQLSGPNSSQVGATLRNYASVLRQVNQTKAADEADMRASRIEAEIKQ